MRHIAFTLLVTGLVGCDAVIGVPGTVTRAQPDSGGTVTPPAETGPKCPASSESNACFKCTDESCCTQYEACKADPRCGDFYKSCIPECKKAGKSFDECVVECDSKNGAGHALYAPYLACSTAECLGPCADGTPDACITCAYASCREVAYACTADRECDTLTSCVALCEGKPDRDTCAAKCNEGKSPEARDKFNRKFTCFLTFCQKPCLPTHD